MAKAATVDQRVSALELAHSAGDTPEAVVARANAYLTFLLGSTAVTAPAADPEPPRLDDPVVKAETAAELAAVGSTAEPTPQPDPTPAVTAGPTVTAETVASPASGSAVTQPVEQVSETVQPAATNSTVTTTTVGDPVVQKSGGTAIDKTKVQAAVIAATKGIGRDATINFLTKHGGSRLPEVPETNHRALFEDLNAALVAAGKEAVAE